MGVTGDYSRVWNWRSPEGSPNHQPHQEALVPVKIRLFKKFCRDITFRNEIEAHRIL